MPHVSPTTPMKTCLEFPLHLWDAAKEVIQIVHVNVKHEICQDSQY